MLSRCPKVQALVPLLVVELALTSRGSKSKAICVRTCLVEGTQKPPSDNSFRTTLSPQTSRAGTGSSDCPSKLRSAHDAPRSTRSTSRTEVLPSWPCDLVQEGLHGVPWSSMPLRIDGHVSHGSARSSCVFMHAVCCKYR